MSLAYHPHLSDRATLRALAMARALTVLCAPGLLSACAGLTERVVARGEPSATSAMHATGASEMAATSAHYASHVSTAPESTFYSDRKASRMTRLALQAAPRATRESRPPRAEAKTPAEGHVAYMAPPLGGRVRGSAGPVNGDEALSRGSPADIDVSSIAFNVPTSMTLERRTLIQLALADGGAPLADGMAHAATDAHPHIGQYIEARLSGSEFVIEPVTANTQPLGRAKPTEWLWLVTPKKPGRQQLQLTVTALTETDSAPVRRALPTFQHTVQVGTRWQDEVRERVAAHAAWLWAASCAAPLLLLWAYARWRRKHRRWFRSGL